MDVAQAILANTLSAAENANASTALGQIARHYARHYAWGKALRALKNCQDIDKVSALTQMLMLWAEKRNPQLIEGAVALGVRPRQWVMPINLRSKFKP